MGSTLSGVLVAFIKNFRNLNISNTFCLMISNTYDTSTTFQSFIPKNIMFLPLHTNSTKLNQALKIIPNLLWEPYPSHHNGLFSPLLVLRDFATSRIIPELSESVRDLLSFLCNAFFLVQYNLFT